MPMFLVDLIALMGEVAEMLERCFLRQGRCILVSVSHPVVDRPLFVQGPAVRAFGSG